VKVSGSDDRSIKRVLLSLMCCTLLLLSFILLWKPGRQKSHSRTWSSVTRLMWLINSWHYYVKMENLLCHFEVPFLFPFSHSAFQIQGICRCDTVVIFSNMLVIIMCIKTPVTFADNHLY
jgi:hypothetical protein